LQHQVIIVCGETCSGKTTQLPKICLEAGRGLAGLIGHTQPRRILLATNVAETSLTVPGIRSVIDTGYARISRYSHRSKLQRLPIEKVARLGQPAFRAVTGESAPARRSARNSGGSSRRGFD